MESSVTYTFQEPFSVMQNRSSQASSVSTESSSRAREDIAFSFVTSQRPAMLLTVSTFSQQYIAVILAKNGTYRFDINTKRPATQSKLRLCNVCILRCYCNMRQYIILDFGYCYIMKWHKGCLFHLSKYYFVKVPIVIPPVLYILHTYFTHIGYLF